MTHIYLQIQNTVCEKMQRELENQYINLLLFLKIYGLNNNLIFNNNKYCDLIISHTLERFSKSKKSNNFNTFVPSIFTHAI